MTFSAIGSTSSAGATAEPGGEPVLVPNAVSYRFQPQGLDIPLRIYVAAPDMEAPAAGFPVLYAFDADISFVALANMANNLAPSGRSADRGAPIVVGIGYEDPKNHLKRRIYDLTPPTDSAKLPKRPNGQPWPKTGGGDRFLDVLINEIKPFVAKHFKIDETAETLAGHSLGGLLTLHALLTRPDAFDRYVASSPSLWFGEGETSDKLIALQERTAGAPGRKIPLRLTVGLLEETPSRWRAQTAEAYEKRKAWLENNRMVRNNRDLADALMSVDGTIRVSFEGYSGLDHGAANFPAFFQALQFAVDPNVFDTERE